MERLRGRSPRAVSARVVLGGLFFCLTGASIEAQAQPPENAPPINYAYASAHRGGTGFFTIGGQSTTVVRMPFAYGLLEAEKGRWGIKLRFPVSLGFHDLEFKLADGRKLRQSVGTVAFTPGVELEILAREEWRLKPYAEVGLGSEDTGDLEAFLWEAGIESLWLEPRRSHEIRIGAALKYDGFRLLDGDVRDSYGVAEGGIEVRWLGRFEVEGKAGDPGAYLVVRRFLPEVELVPFRGESYTVTDQLEVGFTIGTRPGLSVWGLDLPRFGLAYRWGDGLASYRLNFGFPF